MELDSEIILLGTGVAPLVAAGRMLAERKSVLVINPDWDFFREDSELPLDPLWPPDETLKPERLARNLRKKALAALRPDFPGAIELWPRDASGGDKDGYQDVHAPHVRTRSRLWVYPLRERNRSGWSSLRETIETMYLEASEAGLKPSILDAPASLRRFPGASLKNMPFEEHEGVLLPKMCDVDVRRYRNGLLEFVRERLGPDRVICSASQIEVTREGLSFRSDGINKTAKVRGALLVFWTPRLSAWIATQAKRADLRMENPRGVRLWEEWSLLSRDSLEIDTVGSFEDMTVWADVEGAPTNSEYHMMSVLKAGPLLPFDTSIAIGKQTSGNWLCPDSFASLERLCHDLLKWDRFSVRAVRPRAVLDWSESLPTLCSLNGRGSGPFVIKVVRRCDGPLVDVVNAAREACSTIDKGAGVT